MSKLSINTYLAKDPDHQNLALPAPILKTQTHKSRPLHEHHLIPHAKEFRESRESLIVGQFLYQRFRNGLLLLLIRKKNIKEKGWSVSTMIYGSQQNTLLKIVLIE